MPAGRSIELLVVVLLLLLLLFSQPRALRSGEGCPLGLPDGSAEGSAGAGYLGAHVPGRPRCAGCVGPERVQRAHQNGVSVHVVKGEDHLGRRLRALRFPAGRRHAHALFAEGYYLRQLPVRLVMVCEFYEYACCC